MSPLDCALLPVKKTFVFSGRAPRAEYWWFYLGTVVVGIFTQGIDALVGTDFVNLAVGLVLLVPTISVSVRRLHDIDRTGWWITILFLPFLAVGIAAGFAASTGTDVFTGMMWFLIPMVIAFLVAGITLLVFMVTAGTEGPNDYGPDPYGPNNLEEVFA